MSILIVDKNPSGLEKLERVIKKAGYLDVVSAMTLKDALQKVDKGDDVMTATGINLIIVNLSARDIQEECKRFRENSAFSEIPIIAITCTKEHLPLKVAIDSNITECVTDIENEAEIMMRIRSVLSLKYEIKRRKALERNLSEMARQLEHTNQMLQMISSQDGLTGVANRRYFDQFLSNEWRRAIRNGSSISVSYTHLTLPTIYSV